MNSARVHLFIFFILLGVCAPNVIQAQSADWLGPVSKEYILSTDRIYEIYIKRYEPDKEAVEYLSTFRDSVQLVIFIGSWCRESKKYIPGLMKTLELAESDFISTKYIGVDAKKKVPQKFLKEFDIKYIPTVVVLKGNKELGRIEEKPLELIETDLIQILKKGNVKKEYKK